MMNQDTMTRIKIADATPRVIDWLVAKQEGHEVNIIGATVRHYPKYAGDGMWRHYSPSTDPSQGHPILERIGGFMVKNWLESKAESRCEAHIHNQEGDWIAFGPTILIAGLRCYLASRLGPQADVPDELMAS